MWIGLSSLDDLFTDSDSVVLLLICENVKNKLHRDLPFFNICMKNLMICFPVSGLLILHKF